MSDMVIPIAKEFLSQYVKLAYREISSDETFGFLDRNSFAYL